MTRKIINLLIFTLLCAACSTEQLSSSETEASSGPTLIVVKFSEGTDIRLRDGKLVSISSGSIPELDNLFEKYPVTSIERQFTQPEEEIAQEKADLESQTGEEIPDLNLYFRINIKNQKDAESFLASLRGLPIVETAYFEASPAPPPVNYP